MKIQYSKDGKETEIDIFTSDGLKELADLWIKASSFHKLMYEPTWCGVPVIQYPSDMIIMQELIWKIRPDVIIETGVAHGGSLIFYSSILELIGKGEVIGIDVDIRKYNEIAIKSHPMSKRIKLIQGSSIDSEIITKIQKNIKSDQKILVVFDSCHSYQHVKKEMELYSSFVSQNSYMVVMDGAQSQVWDIPNGRPEWKHDNPLRAINEFLEENSNWEVDKYYNRFHITSNPCGFLKRKEER